MPPPTPFAERPGGLRAAPGRRGVWRAAPGREAELLTPDGPPLTRWAKEGRLELVKGARHRSVWRLRLDDGPDGAARVVYVKLASGGRGGVGRAVVDPRRPFREARAAALARAAGVATAAPLLAGRFGWNAPPLRLDGFDAGPRWRRGPARVLITESVERAAALPAVLAAAGRLAPATRRAVTVAVAAAVAKLHAAGLFPGDLHPGNLFIKGLVASPDGGFDLPAGTEPEPVLIDLAPLLIRRGWPGFRRRTAGSLGMLAHGTAGAGSATDRLRALAAHRRTLGEELKCDPAAALGPWRDWVAAAGAVRDRESARRHARRDRHWRRGCRGMRMLDRRTRCVAELTDADAARFLDTAERAGETDGAVWNGRTVRTLALSPAAARGGWETGHALRRRGLPVAEPLLCRQDRHAGLLILAGGAPVGADSITCAAIGAICERLRGWGYTLDGPRPEDLQQRPGGAVELANPAAVRKAGRDEPAPELEPPAVSLSPDFTSFKRRAA